MKLYKEILSEVLKREEINITFPNLKINAQKVVEMKCYEALQKIKTIIENDGLDDFECVEAIVCIFEEIGSDGGSRHDFG